MAFPPRHCYFCPTWRTAGGGGRGLCCLLSLLIPQTPSVPSLATHHHTCVNKTESFWGSSLAVQGLRLCVSTMRDVGAIFGWGTQVLHAVWPKEKQSHFKHSLGTFSSSITYVWANNIVFNFPEKFKVVGFKRPPLTGPNSVYFHRFFFPSCPGKDAARWVPASPVRLCPKEFFCGSVLSTSSFFSKYLYYVIEATRRRNNTCMVFLG